MPGFDTIAIHAGADPDPATGAVSPPIYQTSTYKQDGVGGLRGGYEYSRSANPTRTALETALAQLEGGVEAAAFASGLAAEDTLLRAVCEPGDHVVVPDDAYGGTYRLFARVLQKWGLQHTTAPVTDAGAVASAVRGDTRMIWVETPTNPLLGVADLRELAGLAKSTGALLVVDNTFASPALQRPLQLGADVVVHSTTKYLGGHSDVVGGGLVFADADVAQRVRFHQNAMGAVSGPFDSWLVLRGLRTLSMRMQRHCENAAAVAEYLLTQDRVSDVLYPGLADHPGHEIAARQMSGFGGMVSFRMAAGAQAALAVCDGARLFTLAESLGGVESLIEHPAQMTHASVAGSALEVPADLVRLSVGCEAVEDLIADLDQALAAS